MVRVTSSQFSPPTCYLAEFRAHGLTFLTAAYTPLEIPSQTIPPVVDIGPIMYLTRCLGFCAPTLHGNHEYEGPN